MSSEDGPITRVDEMRLRATNNAAVWAEEFHKVCPDVDEGLMIGWFANAMAVEEMLGNRRRADELGEMRKKIYAALDELGVPSEGYPAPVVNAVKILREVLG